MLAAKKYSWARRYLADGRACLSLAAVAQPVKGTKRVPCQQWRHSLALHQTFRHPATTLLSKKPLALEFGRVLVQKARQRTLYLGPHLTVLLPGHPIEITVVLFKADIVQVGLQNMGTVRPLENYRL